MPELLKKGKFSASVVARALIYLAIFLPAAFGFLYVYLFGVNVILGDEWDIVERLQSLSSGTLTLGELFTPHVTHRIFFPRIVMLALASITDYNTVAELYLTEVCFLAVLVLLLLVFRSNISASLLFFVPIAFLVFSPEQSQNMLQGFQLSVIFPQTFGVLTFFLIYLWGRGHFEKLTLLGAVGSATIATFSTAQGLMVWPAGLLQLLISPSRKPAKKLMIGIWVLIGTAEWIIYFIDFPSKRPPTSIFYALKNPVHGADYFLTLLGGSLFSQHAYAAVAGGLLVCLIVAGLFLIYRAGNFSESSFWITLLCFSLLCLASITAGRTGFAFVEVGIGIEQALSSKYATYSILSVISIYAIHVKLAADHRSQATAALAGVLLGLILVTIPASYVLGLQKGKRGEARQERAAFVLATYDTQRNEAIQGLVHRRPEKIRTLAPTLQKLDYNVFSEARSQPLPPRLSDLSPVSVFTRSSSTINGKRVNNQDQSMTISKERPFVRVAGWAVDTEAKKAAGGVYINIDGKVFPAFYGIKTNGLAKRFDVPAYQNSGFRRAIPISEIGEGTHELSILVVTNDKEEYYKLRQKVTFAVK